MAVLSVSQEAKDRLSKLRDRLHSSRLPPGRPADVRAPSFSLLVEFLIWHYEACHERYKPHELPNGHTFEPLTKPPGRPVEYTALDTPWDKPPRVDRAAEQLDLFFNPD